MIRLVKSLCIAFKYFKGKKDLGGNPYLFHLFNVSMKAKGGISSKIVGLLHDVIEDIPNFDVNELSFLNKEEIEAIILLTKTKNKEYYDYILSIKKIQLHVVSKLRILNIIWI